MSVISIHLPEVSGLSGQHLFLRSAAGGVLLNTGGDELTESPAGSAFFSATVDEPINVLHSARAYSGSSETAGAFLEKGWVRAGGTLVEDRYPGALSSETTAIAAALAGTPISPTGRVAEGGAITLYVGDDCTEDSDTLLEIPVSDPAGGLFTLLDAIGVENLSFGASRANKAASLIPGTVVALDQSGSGADQLLIISVEIIAAGTVSGCEVKDDYEYQISQRQNTTDDFVEISGALSLLARRVSIP